MPPQEGLAKYRRAKLAAVYPAPAIPAMARVRTFVVTQVRQALQQTVAMGAFSPYLAVAWAMRPVEICFTASV
jgi:hypothetical protein